MAQDATLTIGDIAPSFEATTADGETWKSEDVVGDQILVVYFYPAAMTGGCTDQACSFRDNRSKLTEMGAEVVGVSGDLVESLKVFKITNNLNFPLLSDPEGSIASAFGVPLRDGGTITREVDGETVELTRGVTASRWTFIIDREGTIVYRDTEVDAAGDSEAVMTAIEQLALNQ
ncbi:MAG: peroxiredoxin [Balneolaceae bacterium]